MIYILIILLVILGFIIVHQYHKDIKTAYKRLESYNIKTMATKFGIMSYVDEGKGEVILISHGIFGGYDQGSTSLNQVVGEQYRKVSISRFGYPGSKLPNNPTPKNQAKVFIEILDELGIKQAYILATSAGGAAGFQFALTYPDRSKGLILLSSSVPDKKRNT
ncbi:alpha/beta fold hydrolase, partial [Liquorilactobacillus uvarum]